MYIGIQFVHAAGKMCYGFLFHYLDGVLLPGIMVLLGRVLSGDGVLVVAVAQCLQNATIMHFSQAPRNGRLFHV